MRALLLASLMLVAAAAASSAADMEANKRLYRETLETLVNKRQPEAADRFFTEQFIEHNPNLPQGLAGRKQFVAALLAGFSDYHGEIQEILAEGDKVVVRTLWTGTQDGPFLGRPATGNKVRFTTADFFRVENGKLAEHWDVVDSLPRAISLGLVEAPKAPAQAAPPPSK
jgi:predicted SnoaL-like aldol condensation-catalyzing enzyme